MRMLSTRFRGLCTASATAMSVGLFAAPALAQSAPAQGDCASLPEGAQRSACLADPVRLASADQPAAGQPAATDQGAAIVVTGSRLPRPNLDSSVPITSVGPQELTERGDVSLGDALNQLPSLRTTF